MKRLVRNSSTNASQTVNVLKEYQNEKKISNLKLGEEEISFTVLKDGKHYYDVKLKVEDQENENWYKCDCGNDYDFTLFENSVNPNYMQGSEVCDSCMASSLKEDWEEAWLDQ